MAILVVDDDLGLLELLTLVLEEQGYVVHTARHGREGLDYLQTSSPPCLVLLDLMMPEMDGWELRKAMLADPALASIPVAIMPVSTRLEAQFELAPVDVLVKPFQREDLFALVAKWCGTPE